MMTQNERIEELTRMLTKCREQFIEYADHHIAKGALDKAIRNRQLAIEIGQVLIKDIAALEGAAS